MKTMNSCNLRFSLTSLFILSLSLETFGDFKKYIYLLSHRRCFIEFLNCKKSKKSQKTMDFENKKVNKTSSEAACVSILILLLFLISVVFRKKLFSRLRRFFSRLANFNGVSQGPEVDARSRRETDLECSEEMLRKGQLRWQQKRRYDESFDDIDDDDDDRISVSSSNNSAYGSDDDWDLDEMFFWRLLRQFREEHERHYFQDDDDEDDDRFSTSSADSGYDSSNLDAHNEEFMN